MIMMNKHILNFSNRKNMTHRKTIVAGLIVSAMLFFGGVAQAQVVINGNVYGGGLKGQVNNPSGGVGNATVTINGGTMEGSVFGGGKGVLDDEKAGLVEGNTTVTMIGGTVERSVYGGGELGSVGTFTTTTVTYPSGTPNAGTTVEFPTACNPNTGLTTVSISGGTVGRADQSLMPAPGTPLLGDDFGYVFCGGRGEVDTITNPKAIALGIVGSTCLNISGTALITASAYGGSENGIVLGNTLINMSGGQIGVGHYKAKVEGVWVDYFDGLYTDEQWAGAITAVNNATIGTTYDNPFHECDAWPYGDANGNHFVYDVFADPEENPDYTAIALTQGASINASDGHSFFGNLFGGGSGYYPYAPGQWRRTAGVVKGNTTINLTGGHVLTSLYAGNETTDILGTCTVNMSGGTIGVPRTLDSIHKHPVTCYLFGGGMGDPRTYFNKWTNVNESEINVTGGTIFGSIFGGGEEGHVLGDVTININEDEGKNTLIGTLGYSYVDGNVFGAGRGLSGTALTAGGVGGNVEINIEEGTMLGSVYGGGRLASVGTHFVPAGDEYYGQFQEDDEDATHGHVTINISGGTIGNDNPVDNALPHPHGGNVFGGSMGRLKDVNDVNYLPLWPSLAKVKETHVNITGGTIKNVVYGGSEYGSVRDSAVVVVNDADIYIRKVYGGGYGSDIMDAGYVNDSAAYPALLAGRVEGNTLVKIMAGKIGTNVYGGGDLATVGVVKNGNLLRGNTNVVISGGFIGDATNYTEANYYLDSTNYTHLNTGIGHVYGGGQGVENDISENYKNFCNVNRTNVTIKGGKIYGSVFGGGADSHVLDSTCVIVMAGANVGTSGITSWDGNVFGGGMGSGHYGDYVYNSSNEVIDSSFIVRKTCGRVGGNTYINMEAGTLMGSIFGGGFTALTGVDANGEPTSFITENVYDSIHHGRTTVEVSGGIIGIGGNNTAARSLLRTDESVGDIFGGGKGDITNQDNIWAGRVANSRVTVTGTPTIYGSIFGGGEIASVGYWQDNSAHTFYSQTGTSEVSIGTHDGSDNPVIGTDYEFTMPSSGPDHVGRWTFYETIDGVTKLDHTITGNVFGGCQGDANPDSPHWVSLGRSNNTIVNIHRGTIKSGVFGGSEQGTVIGNTQINMCGGTVGKQNVVASDDSMYSFGSVYGGGYGSRDYSTHVNDSTYLAIDIAGRTYGNAMVNISGGQVYENVYGGGDLASVGYVKDDTPKNGLCTVNITGTAEIGPLDMTGLNAYVYGGGKGVGNDVDENFNAYCNVNETAVTVNLTSGRVYGSLFGGSADGHVLGDANVTLNGGMIGTDGTTSWDGNIFGGGRNYLRQNYAAGRVGGNITVEVTDGNVLGSIFGGGRNALTGFNGELIQIGDPSAGTFQALQDGDHGHTTVKVSGGTVGNLAKMRECEYSIGEVYGGGKGSKTGIAEHPVSSALLVSLVKNTEVEISGTARIYGNVYGGGEVGNVGNYTWTQSGEDISNIGIAANTGHAKVTVKGGTIGMDNMQMITTSGYPDDFGHVFGGGQGWVESPTSPNNPVIDIEGNRLVEQMASVVTTEVTISDNAFVLGSVYGGAENGHVSDSTWVKIQGGQIGVGEGYTRPYTATEWNSASLAECAHWNYVEGGDPYDINILDTETNKPKPAKNGATFYGNVFGGGSGYYPYGVDGNGNSQWLRSAGQVKGNTRVEVTGGHILTSLYGGNETTDVGTYTYNNEIHGEEHISGGQSTVIMSGGTLGVPRTLAQIQAHPVTCYVFGSGKGDPRFYFNTWTNVWNAIVEVKGTAWVYGSVFGGGEEGHVLNDVDLDVSGNAKIGTLGYSYVDGNIFGGGRGFTGSALTAGTVGGNINIDITGGTMLGSVYGGGRLASVGTYLVDKQYNNGSSMVDNSYYGQFQPGDDHGYITINISGGTIDNDHETATLTHTNPNTFGGNVFGGCMGKFVAKVEGGETPIWPSLARAKQTEVTISGTALVKNSVFGGGEIGTVRDDATVNIEGGTIGGTYNGLNCGHVFGGGKGLDHPQNSFDTQNDSTMAAGYLAGRVYGNTYVNISGGHIYENVFGGGKVASVGWVNGDTPVNGLAKVNVTGGEIGPLDMSGVNAYVFGGPKGGSNAAMKEYCNVNRTEVEVDYTDSGTNRVWGSLFGGGSDGHVLGNATVTLKNGTIGTDGSTGYDGNIFGGGRNYHELSLTAGRVGGNITVNMQGGTLQGSIFGGGRQGLTGVNVDGVAVDDDAHGNITINVTDGTVGTTTASATTGHVFGGGKGKSTSATDTQERFGETRSTRVNINGDALVNGNVFGGSENGHVLQNANVTIAGNATIGAAANDWQGRVYGGGRGIDKYESPSGSGNYVFSPTAGKVNGIASTTIKDNAIVNGSVLGGGEVGLVEGARIVNIEGGTVRRHVLGGNNTIPDVEGIESNSLMTVNVRGGVIEGSVFGGSYNALEGNDAEIWNSFVNVTGGTIGYATTDVTPSGNVYAAGYGGEVDGSVCLNVGLTAVQNAPTFNSGSSTSANIHYKNGLNNAEPTPAKVKIEGNLYDGSYRYQATPGTNWLYEFDITGYSTMFIDGEGYNTANDDENSTLPYMNIFGGIYGGGNYCESGVEGRKVIIRKYGERVNNTDGSLSSVTRTLTTLQRSGVALIDNSNIHFTGEPDLSQTYEDRDCFGVLTVDDGLYVANGSSFVLGTDAKPAYMDSIVEIRSLHLKSGNSYDYINSLAEGDLNNWELIGVNYNGTNTPENVHLYYTETSNTTPLTSDQENVIIFNGDSRMWVRYKNLTTNDKVMYGPVYGFFRVRANDFTPNGTKGFAYARPKLTAYNNPIADHTALENISDGGFLSYNIAFNDFITLPLSVLGFDYPTPSDPNAGDGGSAFTCAKQYPYYNFSKVTTKGNMEEYREWVLPAISGHIWYVDGRGIGNGGWGKDGSHENGWGDYPDKPKLTITGNDPVNGQGIFYDPKPSFINPNAFNPDKDIIFVVGPIQALNENENLNPSMLNPDPAKHYSLKLYRYPGGHTLSNNLTDAGGGVAPTNSSYNGVTSGTAGPGANLDAMIIDNTTSNFVMDNVLVDGLFKEGDFTQEEILMYTLPTSYNTEKLNVSEPLVVTLPDAQLTLKGGTQLQHGYNKTEASTTWYHNADYLSEANVHHSGALYVDEKATVNVEGLVTITGNLQKNGDSNTECNVYLPTFNKYLNMTNAMDEDTRIGVTSPIRNQTMNHVYNTFSPVAVATPSSNAADTAAAAWRHCNFYDDQDWFFVNGHTNESPRTTFYSTELSTIQSTALYFGWTWANAVREKPEGYVVSTTPSEKTITVTSPEGLAWLISKTNGENGETASTLADTTIILNSAADIDLQQYIWVPVGIEGHPFGGTFDGQGKLIQNLTINYLGTGSRRYEYTDFGMFGDVINGIINRTFVVGGQIQPLGNVNIGGLAGLLQGNSVISNSEAAVDIHIPDMTDASENASGGLVGLFLGGEIHSSMAMPTFHIDNYYTVGGLVGYSAGTSMLNNSFAYPKFLVANTTSNVISGGLMGVNTTGSIQNCYARLQTSNNLTAEKYGSIVHTNQGNVDNCFGFQDDKDGSNNVYPLAVNPGAAESTFTNCHYFSAVASSDTYGYLYTDNQLYDWDGSNWTKADTCMFVRLSANATRMNNAAGDNIYAQWTRPTLSEINGDYPVLMLNNYGHSDKVGQGEFRSLATYASTAALQYGGPARDGSGNELSTMLSRSEDIFVYGDVTEDLASAAINAKKVAIHEDAAIIMPGALSNYVNTYVGVSFDNSARQTFDVNGLARDWHMLSTPLKDAPLGINYVRSGIDENDGTNDPSYDPYTGAGGMLPEYPFYAATEYDGYFPFNTPYAEYDFYCFNEYTKYNSGTIGSPHWINFKRNGNSHYYSQSWAPYYNGQIDYYPYDDDPMPAVNINEPNLVQGKGYLLALQEDTYLQSHGLLNNYDVTINISNKAVDATHGGKAQNLVGNPFHAYLDFDKFATSDWANSWTSPNDGLTGNAYYVYDADHGYYKSYTVGGSQGGDYANQYIHPHQGFFVKSTASENASNTITFAPSMLVTRSEAGDSNFRGNERPAYPLVNLYAEDNEGRNEVVVIEFNRPENGGGLKVNGLRNGNHLLYAHNGDDDYCAFFAKEGTEKVPVRFKTFEDGIFTMHWNTANGNFNSLYLIDNISGLTCDMLRNDSYTFNALTSDYLSRFYIVFDVTDIDEFDDNHVFAFFDGSEWVVNGKGQFDLIDMTGRILYSTEFVNEQNRVNLSPYAKGVYLMRLSGDMNTTTQKIVHIK